MSEIHRDAKKLFDRIISTGNPESLIEFYELTNRNDIKLRSIGITPKEVREAIKSVNAKLEKGDI